MEAQAMTTSFREIKGGKQTVGSTYELTDHHSGKRVFLNWSNVVYAEELNGDGPPVTYIVLVPNTSKHGSITVKETLEHLFERPVSPDGPKRL